MTIALSFCFQMFAFSDTSISFQALAPLERETEQEWSDLEQKVAIAAVNLHWIPLLSFHQCGGNVGVAVYPNSCQVTGVPFLTSSLTIFPNSWS